jgi:hypothetical protein
MTGRMEESLLKVLALNRKKEFFVLSKTGEEAGKEGTLEVVVHMIVSNIINSLGKGKVKVKVR